MIEIKPEEIIRTEALPYRLPSKIRDLLDIFKWACWKKNTSAVIIFDGRSGMGKSTLAGQCGLYCDPNFGLHKIYFNPEEFLKGLATAEPGSFHLFDEALLISSRASMSAINKMVIQAMSMIRSKRIIVGFCVNSIFDLDKNLALSRADVLFNVYGESLTDRGKVMAFFKGSDMIDRLKALYLNGKKFYDYSYPKSNFNTTFSSYFVVNEQEYEAKKQEGVNSFLSGGSGSPKGIRFKKQRDILIKWMYEMNFKVENIAEKLDITSKSVYEAINKDYTY